MRTDLVAGELALLQSGAYDEHWRLKVANGSGTLIDLSTRLKDGSVRLPDPDAPIGTAEVTLWREINDTANDSLSPLVASSYNVLDDGVTASPLIHIGRAATLELAITARSAARPADGSAAWHEIIGGFVKQPHWPKRYGDIRIELHDRAYKLKRTFVEAPNTYALGTTIEATIQAVLDDVMGSGVYPVTVDDVAAGGTTGSALSVNYLPEIVPVWDAIQALAQSIGWVLWYRYNGSGVAILTLTEPRRTKTVADYTFTTAQIADIDKLTIIEEDIRNVVVVTYIDAAGADQSVTAEDATSISTFGAIRRYMRLAEGSDSPVRSSAAATTLINAALADLKDPDADQSIRTIGAWWPGEPSIDLNSFAANEFVYDSSQGLAPYGISIQFAQGTLASATILARGKPSAGSGTWRARADPVTDDTEVSARLALQNFREISRTDTTIKYGWTLGPNLGMSFIHDFQESQPYTVDKWPSSTRVPDTVTASASVEYTVSIPEAGYVRYLQVEGRKADGTFGAMDRVLIFPTGVSADFVAFLEATVNQTDGSVLVEGWTTDRALSVAYAYNTGTNPTAPTVAMVEAQGTGADGGGLVTGFSSDFAISLGAATLAYGEKIKVLAVAYLNVDGTGPDTTATDHGLPLGAQAERYMITSSAQITAGTITADKIDVTNLAAIQADLGAITAGSITAGSISINAATERILMGAASAPLTGTGVFLGKDGSDYEFRVGDPAGDFIHWNGSTFHYPSALALATGGAFTGGITGTTASFSGDVTSNTSDRRFKTAVRPIRFALFKLFRLRGIVYQWNKLALDSADCLNPGEDRIGLFAQDVAKIAPQAIRPSPVKDGYLAFQPEMLLPVVVEAVKELAILTAIAFAAMVLL